MEEPRTWIIIENEVHRYFDKSNFFYSGCKMVHHVDFFAGPVGDRCIILEPKLDE